MIERTDFEKKQIVFFFPCFGDKLTYKNDNLVILNSEGKIKVQTTCYRLFLLFVVGDTTITTGLLSRANKFGFSLCLMNRNMKIYKFIGARMEGNTLLRKRQYEYCGTDIGVHIIKNKISNQQRALMSIRNKTDSMKDAVVCLERHIQRLDELKSPDLQTILGIEGSASRTYFSQMYNILDWQGRKPRIKSDYINATLDIGYTILFNLIDALLNQYGFDEYCGVLHRQFYMRKSLVCDLMEPMRPVIDYTIRKGVRLNQINVKHFKVFNKRYVLDWSEQSNYSRMFIKSILDNRNELFLFIQGYYRAFMKQKTIEDYPTLNI